MTGTLFFIVGRGRSGTTLLARMLGQHSGIAVAPEGFFAVNLRARYGDGAWSPSRIDAFCRDLLLENRMKTWGLDTADLALRLRDELPGLTYRAACRQVYAAHARCALHKTQVKVLGDKNPHYSLLSADLAALFPDAKFVHMVRDPRDNVLSYRSVPFDLNTVSSLAHRWQAYNRRIERAASLDPRRFLQVRYEALVASPESELSRICQFLTTGYEPQMLRFFQSADDGFYGAGSHWFSQLKGPVDDRHVDKWRAQLSERELAVIEATCAAGMARYGYRCSRPSAGWMATLARRAIGAVAGELSIAAELAVFGVRPLPLKTAVINRYRSRTGRV